MLLYKKIGRVFSEAVILVILITHFQACTDPNFLDVENNPSKIEGRVTGDSGFGKLTKLNSGIEGATVTLARIKADGSLETVSKQSVQTDANGKFVLETDVDGEANLVAVATKGSAVWKAVVTSQVRSGIRVYCQPLNDETTAETDVYIESETMGNKVLTYAEVSNSITAEAAAYIKNNLPVIKQVSASLETQSEVSASAFTSTTIGGTVDQWHSITDAMISAQATLERDLHFALTQTSIDAAFESYSESFINAFINAGFSDEIFVKVFEVSNSVFLKEIVNLSSDARFEFEKRIAELRAKAIDVSVQSKFVLLNASQVQINAIINAGKSLQASIGTAATSSEIVNAFDNYHSFVIDQLQTALGVHGSLISSIELSIEGFKSTLKSSVVSAVSIQDIINAYMNFYSQVSAEVNTVLSNSGAVQGQIYSTTEILILVNIYFD
jgi:hypothetical protein